MKEYVGNLYRNVKKLKINSIKRCLEFCSFHVKQPFFVGTAAADQANFMNIK